MSQQTRLRPTIAELTFQALDKTVHPEFVSSLFSRSFARDGFRLRLHVTNSGHFWEWHRDKTVLVESIAEQANPLPDDHEIFSHRIGAERSEQHQLHGGVAYQTCFQVERMTPEVFLQYQDDLRRSGERDGLLFLLHPNDRLGLSPLSLFDVQARRGSLVLHAYHTFPDENAAVKVQSLIEYDGQSK